MTAVGSAEVLAVFLIFCRIGGCLMVAPGFASNRVPVRIRLFVAIAASLALAPVLSDRVTPGLVGQEPSDTLRMIATETVTGLFIGLLGRVFFLALQTMLTGLAMAVGFGSIPGAPVDEAEPLPAVSSFLMMLATALLFMTDLHWEIIRGLLDSYSRIPLGEGITAQVALVRMTDQVTSAFLVALRITSPFVVYSVIVNLAIAITNKLVPQIPVFFMAGPIILAGGLMLLYFLTDEMILIFINAFNAWLVRG